MSRTPKQSFPYMILDYNCVRNRLLHSITLKTLPALQCFIKSRKPSISDTFFHPTQTRVQAFRCNTHTNI